jgi:hypothetical protein
MIGSFLREVDTQMKSVVYSPVGRMCMVVLITAIVALAQNDPFSSLGTQAQTISTGAFVTGMVELALVVAGVIMMFSGRLIGGLLIAVIAGGIFALGAQKWLSWLQSV